MKVLLVQLLGALNQLAVLLAETNVRLGAIEQKLDFPPGLDR